MTDDTTTDVSTSYDSEDDDSEDDDDAHLTHVCILCICYLQYASNMFCDCLLVTRRVYVQMAQGYDWMYSDKFKTLTHMNEQEAPLSWEPKPTSSSRVPSSTLPAASGVQHRL